MYETVKNALMHTISIDKSLKCLVFFLLLDEIIDRLAKVMWTFGHNLFVLVKHHMLLSGEKVWHVVMMEHFNGPLSSSKWKS